MPDPSVRGPVAELTLVIPAVHDHVRFARLMASAMASKLGYDYDTIENLRIAVSELCTSVAEITTGDELTLTYRGDANGVRIDGHAPRTPGSPAPEGPNDLTRQILEAVADDHTFEVGPDDVNFTLLLRAAPPGGM